MYNQHRQQNSVGMSFFNENRDDLSDWELPWALIWPNDSWLSKMLAKGLVPAIGGADLLLRVKGPDWKDTMQDEGLRYVLGLVRQNKDVPKDLEEALGPDALHDLTSSLRPGFKWDEDNSEFELQDENVKIKLCIGLNNGMFWPERVKDRLVYAAPVFDEKEKVSTLGTGLIYYSDPEKAVHQCVAPQLLVEKNCFCADYPTGLGGEHDEFWSVFDE